MKVAVEKSSIYDRALKFTEDDAFRKYLKQSQRLQWK